MQSDTTWFASARERLIVALDAQEPEEALALVERLRPRVRLFKVGLELFLRGGPAVLDALRRQEVRVFLDLKLLDIPATVRGALQVILAHDAVALTTIHAFNQVDVRAVREAVPSGCRVLGVTLLTSMGEADLQALGIQATPQDYVLSLAERARAGGCDGVVASGAEAAALRQAFGEDFLLVTPGVRPAGADVAGDDQARVTTPEAAIAAGADYVVVGRPIRTAPDPLVAVQDIQEGIARGLERRADGGGK